MLQGLKLYGAENKIVVIDETVVREVQAKFTNPLSFLKSHRKWTLDPCPLCFFLNLLHVNIVLTSVLRYKPHPDRQHSVQLPRSPKDINLALEWTMHEIYSVSTWWKQLLTAATSCQHKKLFESISDSEVHLWNSSFFSEQK